jgi:Rap1a immunity proteins
MSMRIIIIAVAVLLVGSEKASSQELTRTSELVSHCRTVDDYCKGYLDAAELYQLNDTIQRAHLPGNTLAFCPASVGVDNFAKAYVAYIEANPAKLKEHAHTTVLDMLTTDYRCPTQNNPHP